MDFLFQAIALDFLNEFEINSIRLVQAQSASADSTSRAMEVCVTVFEMNMREDYVRRIRDRRSVLYDDIVYSN